MVMRAESLIACLAKHTKHESMKELETADRCIQLSYRSARGVQSRTPLLPQQRWILILLENEINIFALRFQRVFETDTVTLF